MTLLGAQALSAVTFRSASGVSNFQEIVEPGGTGSRQIVIYGGRTGTLCNSTTSTCNTCTGGATLAACNEREVSPNLRVNLRGQSDAIAANRRALLKRDPDVNVAGTPIGFMDGGGFFNYEVTWGALCSAMEGNDANCSVDGSAIFRFGVTEDGSTFVSGESITIKIVLSNASTRQTHNACTGGVSGTIEGFCTYQIFKGDGKVYAEQLRTAGSFPTAGGVPDVKWSRLLFFFEEYTLGEDALTVLGRIRNNSSRVEIPFDNNLSEPEVDPRVDGLENGRNYCFLMANQDAAGNIASFRNPTDFANASVAESTVCASPLEVVGLLDDKKCFIATAAWGSPLDPHVRTLRSFRDQFLKTTAVGSKFVEVYYEQSPRLAAWIQDRAWARQLVQVLLWPVVMLAWLAVQWGLWTWAVLGGAGFFLGALALRRRLQKVIL